MEKVSKTLVRHLETITQCIDRIKNSEGNIPKIEWDILLSHLREMYEFAYQASTTPEITQTTNNQSVSTEVEKAQTGTPTVDESLVVAPIASVSDKKPATQDHTDQEPVVQEMPKEAIGSQESTIEEALTTTEPQQEEPAPAIEESTGTAQPDTTDDDSDTSPLLVDTDTPAVYAEEPTEAPSVQPVSDQPSVETIEGQPNDSLFDEPTIVGSEAPKQEEPIHTPEQPQTLWNKLQDMAHTPTLGESIGATKTISDLFREQQESDPEPQPAEAAVQQQQPKAVQQQPEPKQQQLEPTMYHQPAAYLPPQPEATSPSAHQSSLFDYLKKGDSPQPTTTTLADSLGDNAKDALGQKINNARVSDLRTIININDKFSFMNELFHHNMKGYNDFILRLNAISDHDEALAYVNSIAAQYEWDQNSLAVRTFFSIFDRKF